MFKNKIIKLSLAWTLLFGFGASNVGFASTGYAGIFSGFEKMFLKKQTKKHNTSFLQAGLLSGIKNKNKPVASSWFKKAAIFYAGFCGVGFLAAIIASIVSNNSGNKGKKPNSESGTGSGTGSGKVPNSGNNSIKNGGKDNNLMPENNNPDYGYDENNPFYKDYRCWVINKDSNGSIFHKRDESKLTVLNYIKEKCERIEDRFNCIQNKNRELGENKKSYAKSSHDRIVEENRIRKDLEDKVRKDSDRKKQIISDLENNKFVLPEFKETFYDVTKNKKDEFYELANFLLDSRDGYFTGKKESNKFFEKVIQKLKNNKVFLNQILTIARYKLAKISIDNLSPNERLLLEKLLLQKIKYLLDMGGEIDYEKFFEKSILGDQKLDYCSLMKLSENNMIDLNKVLDTLTLPKFDINDFKLKLRAASGHYGKFYRLTRLILDKADKDLFKKFVEKVVESEVNLNDFILIIRYELARIYNRADRMRKSDENYKLLKEKSDFCLYAIKLLMGKGAKIYYEKFFEKSELDDKNLDLSFLKVLIENKIIDLSIVLDTLTLPKINSEYWDPHEKDEASNKEFCKLVSIILGTKDLELFKKFVQKIKNDKDISNKEETLKCLMDFLFISASCIYGVPRCKFLAKANDVDRFLFHFDKIKYLREQGVEFSIGTYFSRYMSYNKFEIFNFVRYMHENGLIDLNKGFDVKNCGGCCFLNDGKLFNKNEGHKIAEVAVVHAIPDLVKYLHENGANFDHVTNDKSIFTVFDATFPNCKRIEDYKQVIKYIFDNMSCVVVSDTSYVRTSNLGYSNGTLQGDCCNALNRMIHKLDEKRNELLEKSKVFIGKIKTGKNLSSKEIKLEEIKFGEIKKDFEDEEMPLYAKQKVLKDMICCYVDFEKNNKQDQKKQEFIKLDNIKELTSKIEFNYTFLNDKDFVETVVFVEENKFVDCFKKSVADTRLLFKPNTNKKFDFTKDLNAKVLIEVDNKKISENRPTISEIFETNGKFNGSVNGNNPDGLFKKWLSLQPRPKGLDKNIPEDSQKHKKELEALKENKDYILAMNILQKHKDNKKRFIGLANTSIVMDDLLKGGSKEKFGDTGLSGDLAGKIISFSGVEDFGNKVFLK